MRAIDKKAFQTDWFTRAMSCNGNGVAFYLLNRFRTQATDALRSLKLNGCPGRPNGN
jgi:hypothetical protein